MVNLNELDIKQRIAEAKLWLSTVKTTDFLSLIRDILNSYHNWLESEIRFNRELLFSSFYIVADKSIKDSFLSTDHILYIDGLDKNNKKSIAFLQDARSLKFVNKSETNGIVLLINKENLETIIIRY